MYNNIPHELRLLRQWVVWRFEHVKNQAKLTKVPYNPLTNRHASSTDARTWTDFDACLAAVMARVGWDGIGYVLSAEDPYTFVDLDPVRDDDGNRIDAPHIEKRQTEIFRELNSYSELSPSGAGLHIIVRGAVPQGRKRDFVEVYSSGRFMTMTGNVYYPSAIEPRQPELDRLWQSLAKTDGIDFTGGEDRPQTADDMTVYAMAQQAANAQKFNDLWSGNWQQYYTSQSEADFALIDILGFFTHNRAQIKRMFRLSRLGEREKAQREDYVDKMVLAAEDRRPPTLDFAQTARVAEIMRAAKPQDALPDTDTGMIEPGTVETQAPPRFDWIAPPGLIGEMAEFIYAASPRPVKQIALAAAVAMFAGIVGRAWNVSGTGLNLYLMLIAPTGTGKEAISSGIDKLFNRVTQTIKGADEFIGPGDFASAQALIKALVRSPSCVVVSGEFGLRMQQMASKHASSVDVGIKRMLLDLYNKSGAGQSIKPIVYSDKDKNTTLIRSPALTMIGETTPSTLYAALDESLIADGLLPRFLTTEYTGPRPPLNEAHGAQIPPDMLIQRLAEVCHYSISLMAQGAVVNVDFTAEGKVVSSRFDKYADSQINSTNLDVNRQLWNRAHVKALKLAALVAVGIHPYTPVIDEHCMQWACDIVHNEIVALLGRFDRGEVGREDGNEQAQLEYVKSKIAEYMRSPYDKVAKYDARQTLHAAGVIEQGYLSRRCLQVAAFRNDRIGATSALKRAIQNLLDGDIIREVAKPVMLEQHGTYSKAYVVIRPEVFK